MLFRDLIPERPSYRREHRVVGYLILPAFLLSFLLRLTNLYFPLIPGARLTALITSGALLLPALIFTLCRHRDTRATLRLYRPADLSFPLLISAFFLLLTGGFLLSVLCGGTATFGNTAGNFDSALRFGALPLAMDIPLFILLPALAEEWFFRGLLIPEYERRGSGRAILLSTLLFALSRFDLRNLPACLFTGLVFALVYYATNSLYATVILHIAYNGVAFFGARYLLALADYTGNELLLLFFIMLVCLLSLLFFCRREAKIYRLRGEAGFPDPHRAVPYNVQFYTTLDALADPFFLLCVLLAVVGFILF